MLASARDAFQSDSLYHTFASLPYGVGGGGEFGIPLEDNEISLVRSGLKGATGKSTIYDPS